MDSLNLLERKSPQETLSVALIWVGVSSWWVGLQLSLLLAALALRGHNAGELNLHWLAAISLVAGGAIAGSAGSGLPRKLWRHLTAQSILSRLGLRAAMVLAVMWSWRVAVDIHASVFKVMVAMGLVQLFLAVLVEWRRQRSSSEVSVGQFGRTIAGAGIAVVAALSLTMSVGAFPDIYPLSRYAMYANPRTDVGATSIVRYVGTTWGGETVRLPPPVARQTALGMLRRNELDALESVAREAARSHGGLASVVVIFEQAHIAPYPEPVSAVVTSSRQVLDVALVMDGNND